jgi:RNA polymerase sigma factor (sigma-70 family)
MNRRNISGVYPDTQLRAMKTDAQLINEARDDAGAFAELYGRHAEAIHRWACSRTDPGTGEDLTAETFAQAALSLKRFRNEADGSAAPWLFGIAKNLLRRHQEGRRVETAARRLLGMPILSDEVELDAAEERARAERIAPEIDGALALLPAGQRHALELRVVDELPYAQVAARLDCSEVAARLRVMRALESLSRRLKGAAS